MQKKLPCPSACRDILPLVGTDYILLPDNRVARLLTPSTKSGVLYFNLYVSKERKTVSIDKVVKSAKDKTPLDA